MVVMAVIVMIVRVGWRVIMVIRVDVGLTHGNDELEG